jgi:Mg2+ and Co2+ transporter CorA
MIDAYLFDLERGEKVESWSSSARNLKKDNVLWLDLSNPTDRDRAAVGETLELREADRSSLGDPGGKPRIEQHGGYLRVVTIAISDDEPDPDHEQIFVDCLVGSNWIVTAHDADIAALDDFRETAEGEGEMGALDAPSFLATLLEWVITSYLRAFDEIEEMLEEVPLTAP